RGKVASCDCGEEVANIVLMVGGAGVSNLRQGSWTGMHGVGSRGVVAEKRVVGNVIADGCREAFGASGASRGAVGIDDGEIETAHESAPSHAGRGEEVTDIFSAHLSLGAGCAGTNISDRIGIADHGERAITAAVRFVTGTVQGAGDAVSLSGNQIEQSWS